MRICQERGIWNEIVWQVLDYPLSVLCSLALTTTALTQRLTELRSHEFVAQKLIQEKSVSTDKAAPFDPKTFERPDPSLFRYYVFVSLLSGPLTPLVLLPLYFRYITLQYKFDDSGVSMSWGILFKREVYLTYRRIQDIHLTRNLLQRWMGLAKISLQTASGSSQAEMVIEGVLQPERLRDYLYSQMRGAKNEGNETAVTDAENSTANALTQRDRATQALVEIKEALQKLVEQKRGSSAGDAQ
jgi:uncharacterized protein